MRKQNEIHERTILLAEDERDIQQLLEYSLNKEGYRVLLASDGPEALRMARKHLPDIILLDVMMPGKDGIEVCRELRSEERFSKTLIIFLTARSEEYSEIAGFDAGGDDYVTKPVRLRSLIKRIESLQKRGEGSENPVLDLPPFRIDREKYLIFLKGEEIRMPRKEFELLFLLASRAGKVLSRETILEKIWGNEVIVENRTIDVHIRRIRKKIGENYIQTLKGVGYKFMLD